MTMDLVHEELLSSGEPETALRRHMRTCADCAFTAARLGEMRTSASVAEAPPPPPDLVDRIMARVAGERQEHGSPAMLDGGVTAGEKAGGSIDSPSAGHLLDVRPSRPGLLDRLRVLTSAPWHTRTGGGRRGGDRRGTSERRHRLRNPLALGALVAAVVVAGVTASTSMMHPGTVSVGLPAMAAGGGSSAVAWGVWQGPEQRAFLEVLNGFHQQSGYRPKGDALPGSLLEAIAHGTAPDIAVVPQPGLLQQLAHQGALTPLDGIVGPAVSSGLAPAWRDLATVDGRLYGVYFKVATKSTIWYNVRLFQQAGIARPPVTYDELLEDMATLKRQGITPFAMCGASGWTLTDWFENVYLRTAGQDVYNALARHRIPWTDPSVTRAFTTLGRIFDDPGNMVGGFDGAASTAYPTCVDQVFGGNPRAAMLFEGDFVEGAIQSLAGHHQPGTDYDVFPFPSIDGSPEVVSAGGDMAVMLHDTPQSRALIRYLASPAAGEVWARLGGFISPNQNVPLSSYPDDVARTAVKGLLDASAARRVVFDMSDHAPPAFGSAMDSGEWADLRDWLRNHQDPDILQRTQRALERDAAAADGREKP
jgi:alpha-glucoside transport system substrate-binding protein